VTVLVATVNRVVEELIFCLDRRCRREENWALDRIPANARRARQPVGESNPWTTVGFAPRRIPMRKMRIYGLFVFLVLVLVTIAAHAQSFSMLYNFGSTTEFGNV
jgi:hypothetical protein